MRQLPVQRPFDDGSRPTESRNRTQSAIIRRRKELRRQVGVTRLMQQGLTRFEAEEQCEDWVGRKMP